MNRCILCKKKKRDMEDCVTIPSSGCEVKRKICLDCLKKQEKIWEI